MGVHICNPPSTLGRFIQRCQTCQTRRRFSGVFQGWYGWLLTCCACGDRWQCGERLERPFERGWRVRQSERARKIWNLAPKGGEKESHKRAMRILKEWTNP